jgi:hypothetical protein
VRGQISWAKRLDPLAIDPYLAAAARASTMRSHFEILDLLLVLSLLVLDLEAL